MLAISTHGTYFFLLCCMPWHRYTWHTFIELHHAHMTHLVANARVYIRRTHTNVSPTAFHTQQPLLTHATKSLINLSQSKAHSWQGMLTSAALARRPWSSNRSVILPTLRPPSKSSSRMSVRTTRSSIQLVNTCGHRKLRIRIANKNPNRKLSKIWI